MRLGMSVLKGILKQHNMVEFVLYDWYRREDLLQDMLLRLPHDERDMFTTRRYTYEHGRTFPCICLSTSGEYRQYRCMNGTQYSLYTCTVGHTTIHFAGVCLLQSLYGFTSWSALWMVCTYVQYWCIRHHTRNVYLGM